MNRSYSVPALCLSLLAAGIVAHAPASADESDFVTNPRQLTFEGRRAGEGYFAADGTKMVFQSEREPGNPFFQMYVLDLETGDTTRVSPGTGKTTCGWINPDGHTVLFASTHLDPRSEELQKTEIEFRESGKERRYSWDYDPAYDLWSTDLNDPASLVQITSARGYDAEGSYSPDGKTIVFASNRAAYDEQHPLDDAKKELLEQDPAYFIDLYRCDADGSNVVQLTDTPGYDGGPFFSPDGKRICWRRFSENGATAEIMTANVDGSDVRQLTKLNAMSWAPYFHPSDEYLIFTTNIHGFANFELYMVRADGKGEPVRVTDTEGFDGLPVFSPDGKQLSWTSNRTANKTSQIFLANWNHEAAKSALGLNGEGDETKAAAVVGRPEYSPAEIAQHVEFLASDRLKGRASGSEGNRLATQYVADHFAAIGLQPAGSITGDGDDYFDPFEFTAGVSRGKNNSLKLTVDKDGQQADITFTDDQFQPLAFSANGQFEAAEVVFAGYGLRAPEDESKELDEYDSYVHLDVKDKWVAVLRFLPDDVSAERRQQLSRYASLRRKAMDARDLGAKGIIVFSGPESKVKNELIPLRFDGSLAGSSVAIMSVTDAVAARILDTSETELAEIQKKLDTGDPVMGSLIEGVKLSASVDIAQENSHDRNVLGVLQAGDKPAKEIIVIGAHVDHLGVGAGGNSLARDDERDGIHYGADDNASGVAAMLEIAEALADAKAKGLQLKRDIVFAGWSGEELGLLGASRFIQDAAENGIGFGPAPVLSHSAHSHAGHDEAAATDPQSPHGPADAKKEKQDSPHGEAEKNESANVERGGEKSAPKKANPHADTPHKTGGTKVPSAAEVAHSHAAHAHAHALPERRIVACLNLDMVGRLRDSLVLQGVGSSDLWTSEIERRNVPVGLPLTLSNDSYIPTDASAFYAKGVPILAAFTGSHEDYHTPRDTADKINYEGVAKIARLMGLIARSLATADESPKYVQQAKPKNEERRANLRAYLGTVPDYAQADVVGVKLSGVGANGPAEQAGVRGGDTIVELAGRKIENIYDYTYAIEALKIGEEVSIKVKRGDKILDLKVTPGSRD